MHERDKLDEAKYFLSQVIDSRDNPTIFKFNLSAFLTAARSVLQYAHREASDGAAKAWYESSIAGDPLLQFFKDERDLNIHTTPADPSVSVDITSGDTMHLTESTVVTKYDEHRRLMESISIPPDETPARHEGPRDSKAYRYIFDDWGEQHEVVTLAEQYLRSLERLVADGVLKGHISG